MKLYDDPAMEERLWKVRESGLGATAHVPGAPVTWEGWEDSAVPPDRVGDYLDGCRGLDRARGIVRAAQEDERRTTLLQQRAGGAGIRGIVTRRTGTPFIRAEGSSSRCATFTG